MMEAIERRLLSNGLLFRVVSDPRFQSAAWARHMPRLVAETRTLATLFQAPEKPTALLADCSMESMTVLTWLLQNGFRLPRDVSLVCRDWDSCSITPCRASPATATSAMC